MKDYDIYLFDFDGTLFDSLESLYPTFRYGFDAVGIHDVTDEEIESFTHMSLQDAMVVRKIPEADQPLFIEKIIEGLDIEDFMKLIKPFPETIEVLDELKRRGKRMAVVSNNDTSHIKSVLRLLHFPPYFESVVGSDRVVRPKPYADMLFVAFDDMGVSDASKACYVGDSRQDRDTAVAGGIGSIIIDRHDEYDDILKEKSKTLRGLLDV